MQEVVGSIPIGSTIFLARQADPPRSAYPAFLHANAWRGLQQEVVGSIPIGSTIFLARQADPPRSAYPAFLHANAWRGLQQEVVGSIPIGSTIFHGTGTALGAVPCGGTGARRHSGTDREAGHSGTAARER